MLWWSKEYVVTLSTNHYYSFRFAAVVFSVGGGGVALSQWKVEMAVEITDCQAKFNFPSGAWGILLNDKWTLVQVMAWCSETKSYYLNQCHQGTIGPFY